MAPEQTGAHPHPSPLPQAGEGVAPSPPQGERVGVRGSARGSKPTFASISSQALASAFAGPVAGAPAGGAGGDHATCSAAHSLWLGGNTGTRRQMLWVGSTSPHSATILRKASPTGRILRSRSNSPSGLTRPSCLHSALSQSTWSVSEYQVKPTIGTPSLRRRSTFAHSFHSQYTASSPFGPCTMLVSVCITGRR